MAAVDTITGYTHTNILVTDLDAAHDFYIEKLGFSVLPRPDFGGFGGAWYRIGNLQLDLTPSIRMLNSPGPHVGLLAQLVEQRTFNPTVQGSSP